MQGENKKKRVGGKIKQNKEKKKSFRKEGSSRAQTIRGTIGDEDSALSSAPAGRGSLGAGSERGLGDELKSSLPTLHTKPGQRAEVTPRGTWPCNQAHAESLWH